MPQDPGYDASIAAWKSKIWQNHQVGGTYYHSVIYRDNFVFLLKNVREVTLANTLSRGRVLDAGCGTGRFTIPLYDAGFDVTGVDISEEMLEVARKAADGRPIPFKRGSIFELPFESASFDTVVSITVVLHFPQWEAILAEYVRVLRPGGRLIFNLNSHPHSAEANRNGNKYGPAGHPGEPGYFQVEATADEIVTALRRLGVTTTQLFPYDAFNSSYVLRDRLGDQYDPIFAQLDLAFREPGAVEFWTYLEEALFPYLPLTVSGHIFVVADLPGSGETPPEWIPPRPIPDARRLDASTIARLMGPAYQPFRQRLNERLTVPRALDLLVDLNGLLGPRLGVDIDFLDLLDDETRVRFLDQVAWRWARIWHQDLAEGPFGYAGITLPPLMQYDVLNTFTKALKPLAGGES